MIREEMKKIWRPGMVLALLVLNVVFYTMDLDFYISYFPNELQYSGMLETGRRLVETYGTRISEEEMAEFEAEALPQLRKEADQYVRESEIGKKHGLQTYEEAVAFQRKEQEEVSQKRVSQKEVFADQDENYADAMRLNHYLLSEETNDIQGRLYGASWMVEVYRAKKEYGAELETSDKQKGYSERELMHARTVFYGEDKMWQNVLPPEVPEAISSYLGYLLIFICLAICMLLSPLLVHDRMSRMQPLQYSSRRGRKIYKSQLAAVMLTAFILTTAELVLYGSLFLQHGTAVFFPCRMYSFAIMQFCWPNWTHGIWCLMLILLCYLTAFGTAGIAFFLSIKGANYIVMLLKALPLVAGLGLLCPKLIEDAFYYRNALYQFSKIPYVEFFCAGAVFVAGMLLCGAGWRHIKNEL